VCGEGVGWQVDDGNPWDLDLYTKSAESFGMFPIWSVTLTVADVIRLQDPSAGSIDLADLIRTFGGRLEANFHLWHRTLTQG